MRFRLYPGVDTRCAAPAQERPGAQHWLPALRRQAARQPSSPLRSATRTLSRNRQPTRLDHSCSTPCPQSRGRPFYANAIPLDLLKTEQDRIGIAEHAAKEALQATEGDLEGWQDVLRAAIRLAGNCHAAYLKARPSVRRRFNDAVLEAVYIKDRKIGRAEFSEVFAPLFSRPSSNKTLKVDLAGRCVNRFPLLESLREQATA